MRYIIFFFVLTNISYAQVVNIETARMQSDTTGWLGSASAGIALTKNSTQVFSANVDAHLQYKNKKNLWLILGDYVLLKASEQKLLSSNFLHLRYNRKINEWLRWEAFTQAQSNLITFIQKRLLVGTGPRFKIASTKKVKLYAATLAMYEYEEEKTNPVVIHRDLRNSTYISLTFLPTSTIELTNTLFYQPLFKQWNDSRILNQASLTVKASRHFGLYLRWNYLYDRFPAGTAPKTTYNLNSGIDFSF